MKLSHLSDESVDLYLGQFIRSEREVTTTVLHHLREADRRRLYSKYHYKSLFDYAVKRFGYSEDEAYRRISAMRVLKDVPEIEEKIESGVLSLSNLAQAQTFFRNEKKENRSRSSDEKSTLLKKLENCSRREAQNVIKQEFDRTATLFGMAAESIVASSSDGNASKDNSLIASARSENEEIKIPVDSKLKAQLNHLLKLKAHSNPHMTWTELVQQMADLAQASWDPMKKANRFEKRQTKKLARKARLSSQRTSVSEAKARVESSSADVPMTEVEAPASKISAPDQKRRVGGSNRLRRANAETRHRLYLRDQGKCVNCGSTHAVQEDHKVSFARGGVTSLANLRLLCRSCNQRHAIETYGLKKMSSHLKRAICFTANARRLASS